MDIAFNSWRCCIREEVCFRRVIETFLTENASLSMVQPTCWKFCKYIYIYYETKAINSSCKEGNGCRILLLIKRNSRSTEFESVEEKYESNYLKCTL